MKKTVLSSLKEARRLIEHKKNWCKEVLAKDRRGMVVRWDNSHAIKFCIIGAVQRACNSSISPLRESCLKQLRKFCPTFWLTDYNDEFTHKDILTLFDRSITDCENKKSERNR